MPTLPNYKPWPDDMVVSTTQQIIEAYDRGYQGAFKDEEADEELYASMEWKTFGDAAYDFGLVGSDEGKAYTPYKSVLKFAADAYRTAQRRGDCFPAGTMVRMADGSESTIETIKPGDRILAPSGTIRKVSSTIEKNYIGQLVSLKIKGYGRTIEATPDHQFLTYPDLWDKTVKNANSKWKRRSERTKWTPIESLKKDDYVVMPRCEPPETGTLIDEPLAWLLGLYLAEGSMDYKPNGEPKRITLNLSSKETLLAEQAKEAFHSIFGATATVSQVPSKPTVLLVRCGSKNACQTISQLAPGNTYTKQVSTKIFQCPRSVRLALLKGWLDGDGSLKSRRIRDPRDNCNRWQSKLTGTSVNKDLLRCMHDLAVSCDIRLTWTRRRPRKQSKEAGDLHFHGKSISAIYPEYQLKTIPRRKDHKATQLGIAGEISQISQRHFEGYVYCLEVEEEHSFVANGIAVHNCVSWSTRNAADLSRAVEIDIKGENETFVAPSSPEMIYWWRGHSGEGANCSRLAHAMKDRGGLMLQKDYPELGLDLSEYNPRLGKNGRRGPPSEVVDVQKEHPVQNVTRITSTDEAADALANGYGLSCCSGYGFASRRDEDGVARPRGSWAHAMAATGLDSRPETVRKHRGRLFLIQNSWGYNWISGPRRLDQPEGSFWVLERVFAGMIRSGGTLALSNVDGWPARVLPNYDPW